MDQWFAIVDAAWEVHVLEGNSNQDSDPERIGLRFTGSDLTSVATAFIAFCVQHHGGNTVHRIVDTVDYNAHFHPRNIFHEPRFWNVAEGVGEGVERSVLGAVLNILVKEKNYWRLVDSDHGYYSINQPPSGLPVSSAALAYFRTSGYIVAASLCLLRQAPLPIDPCLLLLAFSSLRDLIDHEDLLGIVSPSRAETLKQWPKTLPNNAATSLSQNSQVGQLILTHLNQTVDELPSLLTQQDWDAYTRTIYAGVLFGFPHPEYDQTPAFLAWKEGFNIQLSDNVSLLQTCNGTTIWRELVPSLYTNRFMSAAEFIAELTYINHSESVCHELARMTDALDALPSQALPWTDELQDAFVVRFEHYLQGQGNIADRSSSGGGAPPTSSPSGQHASHRARQMCKYLTGSELPPANSRDIKIYFVRDFAPVNRARVPRGHDVEEFMPSTPLALQVATCFRKMHVALNRRLMEMLREPWVEVPIATSEPTEFEKWMDYHILQSAEEYNTL
ncbi:hypothetical protein K466DRAFT_604254 [Polyporus arcularius HHB13444]|uniref:Uncharacterized protein n=1 Tax=Polyporus arcularius HHB13444 TaxID=1314778 RepID=A0A5C3P7K5_9APHY|nr:hypothetical protein K466DRAFT_604254 [Polyporus arcularius HHB13444]